jgi:hypothetical protein
MIGHISTSRTIMELPFYTDDKAFKLFFHCLIKANFKPRYWKGDLVSRGEFITSLAHLADELSWSVQSVRTCVAKLEKHKELTKVSTQQYTKITVCNYDVYAGCNNETNIPTNTVLTHDQHTTNTRPTTIEERKKENKNTKSDFLDKIPKRKNTEEIRATLYKIFGPDEVHVETIIQKFKKTFMIFLSEEFVMQERAKFMLLDFSKFKYNKLSTDFEIEDALYKHLFNSWNYSDKKKSTSLRKQTDYKAYLINFFTNEHPDASAKKAKGVIAYHESTGVLEQRIKKFAEIREDLISYHKKYFTKYPKLLLFDIFDMCYEKRGPFGTMRIIDNPTDKKMLQILSWLKRQYKEREYHMNTKSIRANMELVKRQNAL